MSFEAITNITAAENAGKAAVAAAEAEAKRLAAEAESSGKAAVEAALARADSELAELRRQSAERG